MPPADDVAEPVPDAGPPAEPDPGPAPDEGEPTDSTPDEGPDAPDVPDVPAEPDPTPGRVVLHRLNRAEYDNTVRDLLMTDLRPAKTFPTDDHSFGFDNIASVLSMSPLLFEKYERAAEKLIDDALFMPVYETSVVHLEADIIGSLTGAPSGIYWNLWSNGFIAKEIELGGEGVYVVTVRAAENAPQCYPGPKSSPALDIQTHTELMSDLTALAFQCDLTRVTTFMLGNAGSNRVFKDLGITEAHHYLSHHGNDPSKQAQLALINTFEVGQLAYLLGKLAAVDEADGTLLDNSLVLFSSEVEDGDSHWHVNLPVLLCGGGGGAVTPGRHLVHDGAPIANLYVSILNALGVADETFGSDGTAPLPDLQV